MIREANYIDIDDDGEGMSAKTFREVYLTIGTSNRARQRARELVRERADHPKEGESHRVILGEKGLGRLSAMRLGDAMEVTTGVVSDKAVERVEH